MIRKKKYLQIRQLDATDCGAACLASVFAFYNYFRPISLIRFEAGTDRNGTSLLGMSETAEKNGFQVQAVKSTNKTLQEEDLPAIAHLNIQSKWYHFVVVYGIHRDGYTIMDPAIGKMKKISEQEFIDAWTGVLLILKPGKDFQPSQSIVSVRRRILDIVYQHKKSLAKALICAVIYSVLGIASAFYIEIVMDKVIPSKSPDLLQFYSLLLGIFILIRLMTGFFKSLLLTRTGNNIDFNLINNYNEQILGLPVIFFQSLKTGEILSRINDAIKIRNFINSTIQEIFVNSLIAVITIGAMIHYSVKLSFLLFLSIPLYLGVLWFLNGSNRKYLRKTMETGSKLESQMVETIKGIRTIKIHTIENQFLKKLRGTCINLLQHIFRSSRDNIAAAHLTELIASLWLLFLLWAGAGEVIDGKLTYGELFSFYSLYAYLSSPMIKLILSNRGFQDAKIATDRLFQIMDLEKEPVEVSAKKITLPDKIHVDVQNLYFGYPGKQVFLKGITFNCRPGTITALAGESGSGKSTLLALLLKFFSPVSGDIFINDIDLKNIPVGNARNSVSFIPQFIELFTGSLGYNISLETESWDDPKMRKAIMLCDLGTLIDKLPGGLNSYISEDGNNFSGGEKQKIALARAIYKESSLILMDEPSSSMDIESEMKLISLIQLLKSEGKTIILAAHKLSLIQTADHILVLKDGSIIESGNHASLISQGGVYRGLWDSDHKHLKYA